MPSDYADAARVDGGVRDIDDQVAGGGGRRINLGGNAVIGHRDVGIVHIDRDLTGASDLAVDPAGSVSCRVYGCSICPDFDLALAGLLGSGFGFADDPENPVCDEPVDGNVCLRGVNVDVALPDVPGVDAVIVRVIFELAAGLYDGKRGEYLDVSGAFVAGVDALGRSSSCGDRRGNEPGLRIGFGLQVQPDVPGSHMLGMNAVGLGLIAHGGDDDALGIKFEIGGRKGVLPALDPLVCSGRVAADGRLLGGCADRSKCDHGQQERRCTVEDEAPPLQKLPQPHLPHAHSGPFIP